MALTFPDVKQSLTQPAQSRVARWPPRFPRQPNVSRKAEQKQTGHATSAAEAARDSDPRRVPGVTGTFNHWQEAFEPPGESRSF